MFRKKSCFKKGVVVFQPFIDPLQNSCPWIIHKIHRKKPVLESLLIKLQFWGPATLFKKTPTQTLSCEISKLFKNSYFEEHLWTSASKLHLKRDTNAGAFREFCELFKIIYFVEGLRTALFNKIASLTPWTHLTVLERDSSTGISLWILSKV